MNDKVRCKAVLMMAGVTEAVRFGLRDSKGRELGAHTYVGLRKYEPATVEDGGYYFMVPGEYYVWNANQTRDGEAFGPLQMLRVCQTLEECEAGIAKYLKGARRRCEKKFGESK